MLFELSILVASAVILYVLHTQDSAVLRKVSVTSVGIFLFEYFTHPLWINQHLESWAYFPIPQHGVDISWVLTIGWAVIIVTSMAMIDKFFRHWSEKRRFIGYILLASAVGLIAEYAVRVLGIREYSSAVYEVLHGIMLFKVLPLEAFYYIPVFMGLVIAFSLYWSINFTQPRPVAKAADSGKKAKRKRR